MVVTEREGDVEMGVIIAAEVPNNRATIEGQQEISSREAVVAGE